MRLTLFLLVQADPRCRLGSIWAVAANSFDEAAQLCPGFIRGQGSSAFLCHTSDYSEPTLILELDNWNDNKRPADSVSGETQRGESPTMWVFLVSDSPSPRCRFGRLWAVAAPSPDEAKQMCSGIGSGKAPPPTYVQRPIIRAPLSSCSMTVLGSASAAGCRVPHPNVARFATLGWDSPAADRLGYFRTLQVVVVPEDHSLTAGCPRQ